MPATQGFQAKQSHNAFSIAQTLAGRGFEQYSDKLLSVNQVRTYLIFIFYICQTVSLWLDASCYALVVQNTPETLVNKGFSTRQRIWDFSTNGMKAMGFSRYFDRLGRPP